MSKNVGHKRLHAVRGDTTSFAHLGGKTPHFVHEIDQFAICMKRKILVIESGRRYKILLGMDQGQQQLGWAEAAALHFASYLARGWGEEE